MATIRVFISYAREDSSAADRLFDTLALHPELDPWLDRKKLQPGDDWKRVLLKNLDESDFVLVLLSSHSVRKTGFVQREIREAIDRALIRPPDQRFIIPVRLNDCSPLHDELSKLHYLDLFPDWSIGVRSLCESFGVQHYTHQYVATGFSKNKIPRLVSMGEEITGDVEAVKFVELTTLPKIDVELVSDEGMPREGAQLSLFIKMWTIASHDWPRTLYRKSDWMEMDRILFSATRTKNQKQELVELVIRQWALAKQLTPYDEDDWRALRKLIQQPTYG